MKRLSILLVFVMVLTMAGCSSGVSGVDQVKVMLRNGEYDKAIEELEKRIEADRFDLASWDLKAEVLIEAGRFDEVNDYMESYLDLVDDNIDNKDFDLKKAVDSIGDIGRDIRREGEKAGDWYETIVPESVSTDELEWSYNVGDVIELDVPKDGTVLYTLDGSSPKTNGMVYKNGIELSEEGYMTLQVVVTNRYEEYSGTSSAYIDVYSDYTVDDTTDSSGDDSGSYDMSELVAPELDLPSGDYEGPIEVVVSNYPEDAELVYTLDGSDPTLWESDYDFYYGYILLGAGSHNVRIAAYDYDQDAYSEIGDYTYNVTVPGSVKVGIYGYPKYAEDAMVDLMTYAAYYDIYIEPVIIEDLSALDISTIPDAVITYDIYAADLAGIGVAADVNQLYDMSVYDYIGDALSLGTYEGTTYMMPLTIRPQVVVYGDYDSVGQISWDFLQGESDWYTSKFTYDVTSAESFMGLYYGLGGEVVDPANPSLNREILVEALGVIKIMMETEGMTTVTSSNELISLVENYETENFLAADWMEFDENLYYSSSQAGAMPLPNGESARYYNVATGMYVSNLTAMTDPAALESLLAFYEYMLYYSYDLEYIASYMGAVPAESVLVEDLVDYDSLPYPSIIDDINNGISVYRPYSLVEFYSGLVTPLFELSQGKTAEEVADLMIENIGQ